MPNKIEQSFAEKMTSEGWEVHRNGYPDYICTKNGEALLVEVKANQDDALRKNQVQMIRLLMNTTFSAAFVWTPETSFVPMEKFPNYLHPIVKPSKLGGQQSQTENGITSLYGCIKLLKKILPLKYHNKIDERYRHKKRHTRKNGNKSQ